MKIYILKRILYLYLLIISYLYISPTIVDVPSKDIPNLLELSDKHLHFIAFFLPSVTSVYIRFKEKSNWYFVIFVFLLSPFLECMHYVLPYGDFQIMDIAFNMIGSGLGVILVYIYFKLHD